MKKLKSFNKLFLGFMLVLIFTAYVPLAEGADYYAGVTFVIEGSSEVCSIIRFQASGFSLSESDALYALLANYMTQGGSSIDWQHHILPSENLANGVTGEGLVNSFLQNGTGVCTINGQPVDQVLLASLYKCDYQGAQHTCIRLYVHTGALNLSAYGIPFNTVAGLGAIVVAEPIWDAATAQIIANPPPLPTQIPLALSNAARQVSDAFKEIRQTKALKKSKTVKGK
jgi:hypothetical protein